MNDVTKLLENARARIADRRAWTRETLARDVMGRECSPGNKATAVRWCATGSLSRSRVELEATQDTYLLASHKLEGFAERSYQTNVSTVNDQCGHAATLRMFDDAIKRSKMGE